MSAEDYDAPDEFISPVQSSTKRFQLVCRCSAYTFPHRFLGGKCTGRAFVEFYWYANAGNGEECQHCGSCDSNLGECQTVTGQEPVSKCQAIKRLFKFYKR